MSKTSTAQRPNVYNTSARTRIEQPTNSPTFSWRPRRHCVTTLLLAQEVLGSQALAAPAGTGRRLVNDANRLATLQREHLHRVNVARTEGGSCGRVVAAGSRRCRHARRGRVLASELLFAAQGNVLRLSMSHSEKYSEGRAQEMPCLYKINMTKCSKNKLALHMYSNEEGCESATPHRTASTNITQMMTCSVKRNARVQNTTLLRR